VYIGDTNSSDVHKLRTVDSRVEYAYPGYLLFVNSGTLFAQPFDANELRITGDATPIAQGVRYHEPTAFAAFSSSQSGLLAYRTKGVLMRLVWYDRTGRELEEAAEPGEYDPPSLRLSPDGMHLTVAASDPVSGALTEDIWTIDLVRKTALKFTFSPRDEFSPVWSSDGRTIVFSTDWKAVPNLYQQKVDGGQAEMLLAPTGTVQVARDWSRDGRWVLYEQREPGGTWDIWALPLFGERKPIRVTRTPFITPAHSRFSPDGRWFAYQSSESGRPEVYVQAFQGSGQRRRVSVDGGSLPHWRSDGKELFYLSNEGRLMAVAVESGAELVLGAPHMLFMPRTEVLAYDVNPDGRRFLIGTPSRLPAQSTVVVNWPQELERR
jgi:hypothetical protein